MTREHNQDDFSLSKDEADKKCQSDSDYKILFDNLISGCGVYRVINDGKFGKDYIIEAFNKKSLEIEGKTAAEVIGKSLFDLRPNIDKYGLIDVFREVWKTGKAIHYPSKVYVDDHFNNYYENSVFKLKEDTIAALYRDVTEFVEVQEDLVKSRDKLERYIEEAPYGVFVADENGNYMEVNKAACKMTGYTESELLTLNLADLILQEDRDKARESFASVKEVGSASSFVQYVTKDGSVRSWIVKAVKLDEQRYLGFTEDVTDLALSQKILQQKEDRYRLLFEDAPLGYQSLDGDGKFIDVNDAWLRMLGYEKQEVVGAWFGDFLAQDQIELFKENFPKFKCAGEISVTFKMKKKNQETVVVSFNGRIAHSPEGNFKQTHCILNDVTKQLEAERELKISEGRLKRSQRIVKAGTWELEVGSDSIWASKEAFDLVGLASSSNLIRLEDFENMIYENDRSRVHQALVNFLEVKGEYDLEFRIKTPAAKNFLYLRSIAEMEYDEKNRPSKILGVIMDITEQKLLEQEKDMAEALLRNQQKLESIGTLASGVAHEINNPINGILNYGQVILDLVDEGSELHNYASEIISETKRVSEIVKNLLDFSRQSGKQHSYARIEDIISKTLSLVRTIFKHDDIALNVDISPSLPSIKCRSQQLEQVLMNLLTNARDSLNEKYEGYHEHKVINIKCREVFRDQRKWMVLVVEDFGMGISQEVKDRIFDPFFTTKGKDRGTGLGLSISFGIVKEHHGTMEVESEEGEYARFIVTVPCDNGWDIS
ncbi:MAG: PAS domain-containing sensor histidine kinase [Clostridia bacterium]|nr:PAS domain-containing sensor histidine kinase [Clostridia bacterium]